MSGTGQNLSRRSFLKSAVAAGATLVALDAASGCAAKPGSSGSPVVVDDSSSTSVLEGYDVVDLSLSEPQAFKLPLGSVLLPGEGTWLPVMAAGDTSGKMNKAQCFSSTTGEVVDTVSEPYSDGPNWVIYDAHCSDSAFTWVELDLVTRDWVLYASKMAYGKLEGKPAVLWRGDRDFDPPAAAVSGSRIFWQVMPSLKGEKTTEYSYCYEWKVGDSEARAIVESPGRFATAPTVSSGALTLTPRVKPNDGVFYAITALDLEGDIANVVDEMILPQSIRPFRAARVADQFVFSIEANYGFGGLLGNMGTYLGRGEGPFVTIPLEPSAGACCTPDGETLVVRSRVSYLVIDIPKQNYSILPAHDRCLDYGEYPATEGETRRLVTFATVKDPESGYPDSVSVRVFGIAKNEGARTKTDDAEADAAAKDDAAADADAAGDASAAEPEASDAAGE